MGMGPDGWEERADRIVRFIADRVQDAKAEGVVLGLSGGLDSALVARLAVMALGPERVRTVYMPARLPDKGEGEIAESLRRLWGHRHSVIRVDGVLEAAAEAFAVGDDALARGNIASRARMMALYHIARRDGLLVLGTTNRSELLTGYFTKHGDGGCDVLPIAGLYKTEVREISRHLGIPGEVIDRAPSADLWEGQTDEGDMGMGYDELDGILAGLERGHSDAEIAAGSGSKIEAVGKVRAQVESSRHKCKLPPQAPL